MLYLLKCGTIFHNYISMVSTFFFFSFCNEKKNSPVFCVKFSDFSTNVFKIFSDLKWHFHFPGLPVEVGVLYSYKFSQSLTEVYILI